MDVPEGDIRFACTLHGAKSVSAAACKRMAGDHLALLAVGLPDAPTLAAAERIRTVCYGQMTAAERDAEMAEAAVALPRLPEWNSR